RRFAQAVFSLVCLPYEAFYSLDAMMRTIWRMLVTHKRLLEWSPSDDSDRTNRNHQEGLVSSCWTMWIAPIIATATVIYLVLFGPAALAEAGPILGFWLFSPAIAWWISRPLARRGASLTDEQTLF